MTVEVYTNNPLIDTDIHLLVDAIASDGEVLGELFRVLSTLLKDMRY